MRVNMRRKKKKKCNGQCVQNQNDVSRVHLMEVGAAEGHSLSLLAVQPQRVDGLPGVTDHGDHGGGQAQGTHGSIQFSQHT